MVICLERCANDLHVTGTTSFLTPVKSRMVYCSGAGLFRLSWKKAVKQMCTVFQKKLDHQTHAGNFVKS